MWFKNTEGRLVTDGCVKQNDGLGLESEVTGVNKFLGEGSFAEYGMYFWDKEHIPTPNLPNAGSKRHVDGVKTHSGLGPSSFCLSI